MQPVNIISLYSTGEAIWNILTRTLPTCSSGLTQFHFVLDVPEIAPPSAAHVLKDKVIAQLTARSKISVASSPGADQSKMDPPQVSLV